MTIDIKFDGNQEFQTEAVDAVVSLFKGCKIEDKFENLDWFESDYAAISSAVFPNRLSIPRDRLISNLRSVQSRKRISDDNSHIPIIPVEYVKEIQSNEWPSDFSIEMETGTGKTYVYLKTILTLNKLYGLNKFVIVVPSVAIREGVISTIRQTKEHFKEQFSGIQYDSYVYDSKNINKLRQFANSQHLQILILNIAAFNKDENIIKRETDNLNGIAPIEFIKTVNPIVILDEPQKMASEISSKSIEELNPLFKLRYSATHKDYFHLIYRLTPIDAYKLKLVKQIDVLSVVPEDNRNVPFIELIKITNSKSNVRATVSIFKGSKKTQISLKVNDDLSSLGDGLLYSGWIVEDIYASGGEKKPGIEFTNGFYLEEGSSTQSDFSQLHKLQIRAAIEDHFDTEMRLEKYHQLGLISKIKPLTLFFIDKVANYVHEDSKFRIWFEEEYKSVSELRKYRTLEPPKADLAHKGYFATVKSTPKDSRFDKSSKEDDEAFNLIMRDKERLLSFEEPVRFIFSHSALAEGWDNPNVFTICNLQTVNSDIRKRQQIGRGLRLPVMENGERCHLDEVNRLTIVASESFENFASTLQREISEEVGISFNIPIKNKRTRVTLSPKASWSESEVFLDLWSKIAIKTRFNLNFESHKIVEEASRRLKNFERIRQPVVSIEKQSIKEISLKSGITGHNLRTQTGRKIETEFSLPDILSNLMNELPISRSTILDVILESGRIDEAKIDPALFTDQLISAVNGALADVLKSHDGIRYIKLSNDYLWDFKLFEERHMESYEDNLVSVTKSIFERIPVDSIVEREFAKGLDARQDIELFLKLPSWFKINTPVGGYNPDWAIVQIDEKNNRKFYLVRETKGSSNLDDLFRETEVWKVTFGRKHFEAIQVDYKVVADSNSLDFDNPEFLEPSKWENALLDHES